MASQGFQSFTRVAIIMFSVMLMLALVHTQGVSAYDDCDGCWANIDDIINNISRERRADFSRHRGDRMLIGHNHHLFRRSASESLECDACWAVYNRLKSRTKSSNSKEISGLSHLVKKAMLNNGWS